MSRVMLAILRSSTPAAAAAVAYPGAQRVAGQLGGGDAGRAPAALDDQRDRLGSTSRLGGTAKGAVKCSSYGEFCSAHAR
jgi:hypothetical protein